MWGGTRKGSGKKKGTNKDVKKSSTPYDYKKWRKEKSEKELANASKASRTISEMFLSQASKDSTSIKSSSKHSVKFPLVMPFFANGIFLAQGEDNYTCAPDTVYSIVEAILLSKAGHCLDTEDEVLASANDILLFRLNNNFQCSNDHRSIFWDKLCEKFPSSFCPRGTIRATVDDTMDYLSMKNPVEVVFRAECDSCKNDLGWLKYKYEGAVTITASNIQRASNNIVDLLPAVIFRHARQMIGKCPSIYLLSRAVLIYLLWHIL